MKTTSPGLAAEHGGHDVAGLVDGLAGVAGRARARPTGWRSARSGTAASPRRPRAASASSPRGRGRRWQRRVTATRLRPRPACACDWRVCDSAVRGYGPTATATAFADVYDDWYARRLRRRRHRRGPRARWPATGRCSSSASAPAASHCPLAGHRASRCTASTPARRCWRRLRAKPGGDARRRSSLGDMADRPARRAVLARRSCAYNTFFNLALGRRRSRRASRAVAARLVAGRALRGRGVRPRADPPRGGGVGRRPRPRRRPGRARR